MNHAEEVAKFAAILEQKGLLSGIEGNVSLIDRETGHIFITPSRRMKLLLTPEDICVVAADGEQIGGTGRRSSEFFLHEAIYRARPDVRAVVHSHSPYLTAYALRYEDLVVPETASIHGFFPRMVCLPFGQPGTHEIHRGIENALAQCPVCLLGGHGAVSVSGTLEDAAALLCAAENTAKALWVARMMG